MRAAEQMDGQQARERPVVLVGPAYPYRGGIAHFTHALARTLRQRGQAVEVVTFARQYPKVLFPGRTQFEDGPPPASRPRRLLDSIDPRSWWRTAQAIAAMRPSAVVLQHWMPFFAPAYGVVAWLLRRHGVPVYAVVHNALPHERRPGDRLLSRLLFRQLDGALILSDAVEADLRALAPRLHVVRAEHPVYDHFGTSLPQHEARAALGLPPDAPTLLFFGFVRRYKGLHVLLGALPPIVQALPDVRLVVAGEFYDDPAPYHAQVARHGLGGHVRFASAYIAESEVATYFSAADVVVQPYVSATQSGVAKIAFHFGQPVITTDVGGLAEAVPHEQAGFVVPPEDPQALAAAVVRFFREGWSDRLEAGARAEAARTGWDPLADALTSLFPPAPHVATSAR